MPSKLTHEYGDRLTFEHDGVVLWTYQYQPTTELQEAPKPCFHPIASLAGDTLTVNRPHDHPWHSGLAMTVAELSGRNFWGGPTYVAEQGYQWLDNFGRQEHQDFTDTWQRDNLAGASEWLLWNTADGQNWLNEDRRFEMLALDAEAGFWAMEFRFELTNVSGQDLVFGSPATKGRAKAGYGSLFWRGPRDFTGCRLIAEGGVEGEGNVNGQALPWIAYTGRHDGSCRASTVIFQDQPDNPRYPTKWFARTTPYATASFSFLYDEELVLGDADVLTLAYRMVVANGERSAEEIAAILERLAQPEAPLKLNININAAEEMG